MIQDMMLNIFDTKSPLVVFFGPCASGKTLALVRMIRYLEDNGYAVRPDTTLRPPTDKRYARRCKYLREMVYDPNFNFCDIAPNYMLAKVIDGRGNKICQILETSGEFCFGDECSYSIYMNVMLTSPNKKVWVFFLEQDWETQNIRNLYADQIYRTLCLISPRDKVVFLFNKVDLHYDQFKRNGEPNKQMFFTKIKQQYPGIFTKYQNTGVKKFLYGEYNVKTVCFSSGVFYTKHDGCNVWTPERDEYCQKLWNAIR